MWSVTSFAEGNIVYFAEVTSFICAITKMMLNLRSNDVACSSTQTMMLRQATRLKLFEHELAGVYAREVRKASFNASQNGAPTKSVDFVGKRRSSVMSKAAILNAKHDKSAASDM